MADGAKILASRVVVVMPNWLGDAVMATPFLRALRGVYPEARIAAVARPLIAAVCEGLVDEVKVFGKGEEGATARWLRGEKFELGVLLPNSFRSALMLWRGGVKRRLGYARGGRSWLLTDRQRAEMLNASEVARVRARFVNREIRLKTWIEAGSPTDRPTQLVAAISATPEIFMRVYRPVPTINYYLDLAKYLGAESPTRSMEVAVSPAERDAATAALAELGVAEEQYVVMVPGANFGASKCWMPERFAAVAEQLAAAPFAARVILAGSPSESPICEAIAQAVRTELRGRVHILGSVDGGKGVSIGALKSIVWRARMMICNDTGPRHIAAALGVPVVTLFGPTDPVWAETFFEKERIVRVEVPCGPCQLKVCPIDHRCMKGISVEMVMAAVRELWPA